MNRAPLLLALSLLLACRPDDVAGDDSGLPGDGGASTTDGGSAGDGGANTGDGGSASADCAGSSLVGSWLSQGSDVSELFQATPFEYDRIDASFTEGCDYTVLATSSGGDEYTITGTWTADAGTSPATIVQHQDQPYTATAQGIWRVDSDTLSFEVVQTDPDYGFTPPTPSAGFGSTSGQGIAAGSNVQTYRRN